MSKQDLVDKFYQIDNLVSIAITIEPQVWKEKVLEATPRDIGPPNKDGTYNGTHYDKVMATSVTISGTNFPPKKTFNNVTIVKKSFYGSLSFVKPSIKLDFSKSTATDQTLCKDYIGVEHLTLNNSKQDRAYVRQPLGYELFRQAGVPAFRCNFASVKVNNAFFGGIDGEQENTPDPRAPPADGVFVNLESFRTPFLENPANKFNSTSGNGYEIGNPEDFDPGQIANGSMSFEGFSKFKERKDLSRAAQEISENKLAGAKRVIAWDAYIRFFAMEALLRHWDGYDWNKNNTYVYNDVTAKPEPDSKKGDISFKFIPSGIDQILPNDATKEVLFQGWKSILSGLAINDATTNKAFSDQIRKFADDIFGQDNLNKKVLPFWKKELDVLKQAGASYKQPDVDAVKYWIDNLNKLAYAKVGQAT